jgi:flavorubredoxin
VTKACVIFDTRYGNTEKAAESFATGLRAAGIETTCLNAREVVNESLKQCDLICVGAPTEAFSAYKPMKEFLGRLGGTDLSGRYGFAFDTKLASRFSGSAAKYIEKELESFGLKAIAQRESAIVHSLKGRAATAGAALNEGEEARFEMIGEQVGKALAAIGGSRDTVTTSKAGLRT